MLKASQTTSSNKLFDFDCVTLYGGRTGGVKNGINMRTLKEDGLAGGGID